MLRLYGSTEVLVATVEPAGRAGPTSGCGTDGVAMTDVEVEVRDEDGPRARRGEPGEIFVRGPNTCVGFFDDPERTGATFDAERLGALGRPRPCSTTTAT